MDIFLIVTFSVLLAFFIVHLIVTFIYRKNIEKTFFFITYFTLFALLLGSLFFDVKIRLGNDFTTWRTYITLLTVLIAAVSFITTVYLSNKTAQSNKENQKSNFLMGLMKNHYDLLNTKQGKIDELIEELNIKFTQNVYRLNKIVLLFDEEYRGRTSGLEIEIQKAKDHFSGTKGKIDKGIKTLEKINNLESEDIKRLLVSYFSENEKYRYFYDNLNESEQKKKHEDELTEYLKDKTKLFNILDPFMARNEKTLKSNLSYEEITAVSNEVFDKMYQDIGHFFRNSYRIVKMINLYYADDVDLRKNYLGILRSQYSENTLLAIYYNAVFTEKGIGYARQLVSSNFFGSEKDLATDNPIHFRHSNLFFGDKDLKVIKKIFISDREEKLENHINEEELNTIHSALTNKIKDAFNYS